MSESKYRGQYSKPISIPKGKEFQINDSIFVWDYDQPEQQKGIRIQHLRFCDMFVFKGEKNVPLNDK